MLFGAILNSLSIPTRIVHDYLDHCWNESMIDEKWVHVDSTLEYPDVRISKKWNTDVQIRRKKNNTEDNISKFIRLYSAI
jgi:transglutaminase/protease-like cytokinesis protein 3